MSLAAVDHVRLAAPAGSEDLLRASCASALGGTGIPEPPAPIPKPPGLAARDGC
ncbi:hypothetical protein [Streptomyces sp. NPDC048623]|uniref:hypothetical protein n=1 Tax=Streptomyces sp. NPDC048623 TaxID=3155761 RepID=UPI0034132D94